MDLLCCRDMNEEDCKTDERWRRSRVKIYWLIV